MQRRAFVAGLVALSLTLPLSAQDKKNPAVVIDTTKGKITIELFEDKAPITVKNFLRYVEDKHYDGTIFHCVMPDLMIQAGGYDSDFKEKPTYQAIKNESANGLLNKRGTIAMARTPAPDSATAQFFINVRDNDFLDRVKAEDKFGYAVFGQVKDGLDVVDEIRRVKTGARDRMKNVPLENVLIRSVRRAQ
jgi:cyclophilin family peptidyl-prolyl cis-trans isomerase